MLRGLFPRLFGTYREGGIVSGKFVASAGIVYTGVSGDCHNALTLTTAGSGAHTLTLAGGARKITVLDLRVLNVADAADVTDMLSCHVGAIDAAAGTVTFTTVTGDGSEAAADPAATDQIHVVLYVDK